MLAHLNRAADDAVARAESLPVSTAYRDAPPRPPSGPCRHCGARKKLRARGLCRGCYAEPAVRALFPPREPPADRGGDCAHCRLRPGSYRRRLCRACYNDRAIRALHPPTPLDYYYPAGDGRRPDPRALLPTRHAPGSRGKQEALALRAAARAPLFVAGDAGEGGGDEPADLGDFGWVEARYLRERPPRVARHGGD